MLDYKKLSSDFNALYDTYTVDDIIECAEQIEEADSNHSVIYTAKEVIIHSDNYAYNTESTTVTYGNSSYNEDAA